MITFNKEDGNLLSAMRVDPEQIHDAIMNYSMEVVSTGNKAVAMGKIYQKALKDEEWMKVLMVFAISGIDKVIEGTVKEFMALAKSGKLAEMMKD